MSDHVQLDLPIVLPNFPDAEDACVDRLTRSLRAQEGVSKAHVVAATNGEPDRLCIHYDPDAISLPRIRQRARSLGTELTDQYGHLSWAVRGISHPRRVRTIVRRLREDSAYTSNSVLKYCSPPSQMMVTTRASGWALLMSSPTERAAPALGPIGMPCSCAAVRAC